MTETLYKYFATCPRGGERYLADELRALELTEVKPERHGVRFSGTKLDSVRACLWSRTASRVLLPLAEFPAGDAEALYQGARRVAWEEHLSSLSTFAIQGVGVNDEIRHSGFLALKVKDAICDRLREKVGRRPDVDKENPDVAIVAHLNGRRADLALDVSGTSLHKRGWRRTPTDAPLKENLAALLLAAAGYDGREALLDPLCGSGTLLVEAAERALGLAAGRRLSFGIERWPNTSRVERREILDMKHAASSPRRESIPAIRGGDIDPRAVAAARDNLVHAGVAAHVNVVRQDARKAKLPDGHGLLLANPPYGERLDGGKEQDLPAFYAELGAAFRNAGEGSCGVYCAHEAFRRSFGAEPRNSVELHNGPIKSRLYLYDLHADGPA